MGPGCHAGLPLLAREEVEALGREFLILHGYSVMEYCLDYYVTAVRMAVTKTSPQIIKARINSYPPCIHITALPRIVSRP